MSETSRPGFFTRLARGMAAFRSNLKEPPPWLLSLLGAPTSAAGVDVIPETAITLSTVWACVNILAQDVGTLPLHIYQRSMDAKGGVIKAKAFQHPLWDMLHNTPNPEMTSLTWRMTLMTHLGLWGNHYSQIIRDRLGRPLQLWPIHPQRVRVMRDIEGPDQPIYYLVSPMFGEPGITKIAAEDMLHIKGLSMTGLVGLSPVGAAREAIGLGLGAQEYGARFFSNDANPGGVLKYPHELSDKAYDRLKKSIEEQTRRLKDKHRMIILEDGAEWQQMSLPPEDAQFLTTRTFQISDVARYYRMPLYKLSENLNSRGSNVEQMAIEYVSNTLMPWCVNIEKEIEFKLFSPADRADFEVSFDLDAQLRGDLDSRYKAYLIGRQWGWLSANDVRRKENLNPIEGGDQYMVPLNMVPADKVGQVAPGAAPKDPKTQGDDAHA